MAHWQIIDGPTERDAHDLDGELWVATVESSSRPTERHPVRVVIAHSALASQELPDDVVRAVETHGESAIEAFLDETEPPHWIIVSTSGVRAATAG